MVRRDFTMVSGLSEFYRERREALSGGELLRELPVAIRSRRRLTLPSQFTPVTAP
jgi:hypothetical protein